MFRTTFRSRPSTGAPTVLLLASLLIATVLVFSGCAAVVSSRPTPETTPPPPTPLSITASSLPAATAQTAYTATLSATGATAPYKWSMTSGSLPLGLAMSTAGQISGMPTQAGSFSFTVQVTDSSSTPQSATANFGLTVKAAAVASLAISTSSLPAGQVNSVYTTSLSGTGGTPAYSWTLLSGQLPPGLSLNASSGAITGTPSQAGSYSFTVKLTDSGNPVQSDVANLSINIAAANVSLQVTTTTLPAGETGSAYSATLAATGGVAPYSWSLKGGTLPSGLTLSAAGLISGTPTQVANSSITVQVKDSASPAATATKTLSLSVVLTGGTLQITTTSLPNGQANVAYSTAITAIGGTKPYIWSVSVGSLPSGLVLNSASGVISGTPTQSGAFSLTIQAKDSAGVPQIATKTLSLNVAAAVTPVQITTASLSGGQANSPYGATLSASGGTTPYTWSLASGSLPAGLTLNASTGQIGGTPTQAGTSSFTVQVKDSTPPPQTATKSLSITIAAVVPPVQITTSTLAGGQVSTAYSATLAANGGATPYSWSLSAGSLPAGLSVSAAGQITGTPTASGTSNFTVRVADSSAPAKTATANLSIAVAAVVTPPVAITTTSLPGGTVSSAYSATLAATGGKTPYSWSLSGGSLPAGLSVSSGGVISGTPTASGTVSFTVRVTDASAPAKTVTANLSIVVAPAVTPPVAITTVSLPGGTVSSAYSATLAATGGKTPYSWSLSGGSLPAGLSVSSGGVISGTPTASGAVSFTVRVTDSSAPAKTATANLSIAVAPAVTPPVTITTASLPGGTVSSAYSVTLAATGGTTPYSWSLSAGSLPAGLSLSSGGVISGTPTASGTVSFTVRVADSSAPAKTATANLSIAVAAGVTPLQITTTSLPDGQVSSSYSKGLTATGGTTPYTWSITAGSLPAGLSLGASTGQITGTPTATGTSSFTVSVKDSSGPQQTDTQVLSIFVSAATTGTSVTSCGTLGNSGATYSLQNDVSASGTCFTVTANNVALNLNGHTVTYNTGNQGNAHAISVTTGNSQGFAVSNGALTEASGATANGAHVINMGVVVSGPTIHDITFTWSSGFSQAINTDYGNSSVTNGAMIYNNTLNDNSAGSCGQVSCRDLLQSASIRLSNAIRSSNPPQIFNNTINGGPQGALECDAPGCIIHDNFINPGNAAVENTNDFAIWCWASCNAYNNTIMTPLTGTSQGRGIQLSGVETSTNGANVHDNTVTVTTRPNNAEYGGCELGGTYGIQFDDNGKGGTAQNNDVTAVADQCWATGLRLTDTETTTNVSQNNNFKAIRKSSGSQACNYIGGSEKTGCAHAVALASPLGFLSKNDTFQGDSDILFFDWDGGSGVTFVSPTFLKGTTNPSPNFHTFVFRNGGTVVSNVHVQDATFGSGTSATDADLPAKGGNNQAASVFIDWSQTITVNKSGGGAAAGATVTFTDTLGKSYTATANGSGVAVVVVPQFRLNNDSGANGIENHNPFNRSVSLSGCTTNNTTGLSISGTGSATVTLGGC
jgi:hypothetical protein